MKVKKVQKVKRWKKNLYENFGYPDNYTDITFLDELRKNLNVTNLELFDVFLGAGRVTQELCVVVLFVVVFVYLYNGWFEPQSVFVYGGCLTSFGYAAHHALFRKELCYSIFKKDFRTVLVFIFFGYILSPVLKTLTDTISTDTIFAAATFMMFVHLVFFDYGVSASIVSAALSLNSALFASVCLASRLASPFHAFVLLTSTVECFALLPIFLVEIQGSFVFLAFLITVAVFALWTVSGTMTALFVCVVIFITVVCPLLFKRWQHHKDNLYGPWDEAIVQDQEM